jgi:hypothetical protein
MRQAIEDVRRMRNKHPIANFDGGSRPDPASLAYVAPFADLDLTSMREGK